MAKIAESVLKGRRAATAAAITGGGRSRRLRSVASRREIQTHHRRGAEDAELRRANPSLSLFGPFPDLVGR